MNIQINPQFFNQSRVNEAGEQPIQSIEGLKESLNLSSGQIISGKVVSMEGNQLMLLLDGNRSLSATLSGSLDISKGQMLSFEVKSQTDSSTILRPLYTNLASESTIARALSDASLPMTEQNVSMVENMMEEGMSVNRQALLDMVSNLNNNPGVSPQTLVQMQKLSLPMDENTIRQFDNYKNFEHQILKDVNTLSDGLAKLASQSDISDAREGLASAINILELAVEEDPSKQGADDQAKIQIQNAGADAIRDLLDSLSESFKGENTSNVETLPGNEAGEGARMLAQINGQEGSEVLGTVNSDTDIPFKDLPVSEKPEEEKQPKLADNPIFKDGEQNGARLKLTSDFLKLFKNSPELFDDSMKEKLSGILKEDPFKEALSKALTGKLLLKPEDVAKEGKIEELYKRIAEHSKASMEILENAGQTGSQAMKSAANITENVQFMNQLNEMLTYVQLPLSMAGENAHGDLYVYTNKKSLREKDGNYTALLHLDMEHLGPMDVYVAMQQNKVNTHFYMKDEETLDLIEKNIGILSARLQKKGYDMNLKVSVKEEGSSEPMAETFLQSEDGNVAPIVSTLSFDVRA